MRTCLAARVAVPLAPLAADLAAEGDDLDALVAPLPPAAWSAPTPADGWSVGDSVVHLQLSDEAGLTALRGEDLAEIGAALLTPAYDGDPAALLGRWRCSRVAVPSAVLALPEGARVPWFGPSMGAASFLTARLMETWAHGQDVADALGVRRVPTERLRAVADLGVRTRGWSHALAGVPLPDVAVRVSLVSPGGKTWTWGPADAAESISGTVLDFCLLVTQRRHADDLGLEVSGDAARAWVAVAQAFAGDRGTGRLAGLPPA